LPELVEKEIVERDGLTAIEVKEEVERTTCGRRRPLNGIPIQAASKADREADPNGGADTGA